MSDDLISRQVAIDAIADYLSKTTYTSSISHLNTGALILAKVPSADAVNHGRWISCSSSEHYKCSCCGTRASFWFNEENSSGWQMDMSEWLSDYCPNCGARMDGEKNATLN